VKKRAVVICSIAIIASFNIAIFAVGGATGAFAIFPNDKVHCEFRNYDDTYLWDTEVTYGDDVEYGGAIPSHPDDTQYAYTFSSWDLPIENITGATVFHAQYFQKPKEYKVTFENYDHSELDVDYVTYGLAAHYEGPTPIRPTDKQYRYSFKGWDVSFDNIVADTIVTAQYDTEEIKWAVNFKNYDGKVLYTDYVPYGKTAVYKGITPVKRSTDTIDYVFKGWDKTLTNVIEDFDTTAVYEERPAVFTVKFINWDGTELYTDHVSYDGTADYFGPTPLRESSEEYVYLFSGWSKSLTNITADQTFVARFTKQFRSYVVTFKNYDGTVLDKSNIDYQSQAIYAGATPTRPDDDKWSYTFTGWDRDLTCITSDLEVYPIYERSLRYFKVIFENYDGAFLESDRVQWGKTAVYFGATPVRNDNVTVTYKFTGWDKELSNIQADTVFTAQYEIIQNGGGGIPNLFYVLFENYDGKKLDADVVKPGEEAHYRGLSNPPQRSNGTINQQTVSYYFDSWDRAADLKAVNESFVTFAQYRTYYGQWIVSYRDRKGTLLYEDYLTSARTSVYKGPECDDIKTENGFIGWSQNLDNVRQCLTVFPVWKSDK
jgi:hypothetical protein